MQHDKSGCSTMQALSVDVQGTRTFSAACKNARPAEEMQSTGVSVPGRR